MAVVESIAAELASVNGPSLDHTDGLTADWGDWWFNIRPSNTEPLLRLNLEARTPPERDGHVAEVLAMIHRAAGETAGAGPTHRRES